MPPGENSLILDHLNELARPLRQRRREDLKLALLNAVFRSDLPTLKHCCAIADMEKVKWSSAEMSHFICEAVSNTEPRSSDVVPGAAVIAYLSNIYPDRIAPSTYNAALIGAVKTNNWQAASMLLSEYRADPNAKDALGRTALMHAAQNGQFDVYELLRFHDASPHARTKGGTSVLHHAVDGGNSRIVTDLVMNAKVDTSATNTANQTASTHAGFLARDNMAELIKYGIYGPFDRTDF